MPIPIRPVHDNDTRAFDTPITEVEALSAIQSQLLGVRSAAKISTELLDALVQIDKNDDAVVTAATETLTGRNVAKFRVPVAISDNRLLGLKAEGYVLGTGRIVELTDKGRSALRDHYLKESNRVRDTRTKPKYVHTASRFAQAAEEPSIEAQLDALREKYLGGSE